jgi:phage-related protein
MKLTEVRKQEWTIFAICEERGTCEFYTWLTELPEHIRDSIDAFLDRAAVGGPPKRVEISHQIDEDIWQWTPQRDVRIAWFYDKGKLIIISHGYDKQRQKTKDSDKSRARAAYEAYFKAKSTGQIEII